MRYMLIVLLLACSSEDEPAPMAAASERDVCDATAQCIYGAADPDGQAFSDQCVADAIFSAGSPACFACLIDLSCANLEAAFEGDAAAQAMCPTC